MPGREGARSGLARDRGRPGGLARRLGGAAATSVTSAGRCPVGGARGHPSSAGGFPGVSGEARPRFRRRKALGAAPFSAAQPCCEARRGRGSPNHPAAAPLTLGARPAPRRLLGERAPSGLGLAEAQPRRRPVHGSSVSGCLRGVPAASSGDLQPARPGRPVRHTGSAGKPGGSPRDPAAHPARGLRRLQRARPRRGRERGAGDTEHARRRGRGAPGPRVGAGAAQPGSASRAPARSEPRPPQAAPAPPRPAPPRPPPLVPAAAAPPAAAAAAAAAAPPRRPPPAGPSLAAGEAEVEGGRRAARPLRGPSPRPAGSAPSGRNMDNLSDTLKKLKITAVDRTEDSLEGCLDCLLQALAQNNMETSEKIQGSGILQLFASLLIPQSSCTAKVANIIAEVAKNGEVFLKSFSAGNIFSFTPHLSIPFKLSLSIWVLYLP
uniref:Rap1 GTPase-GDP dissociation stimulator 1 n=1 Tax=Canis lupus familiaris TaxID=9615 RepID=A0A8P0TRB3_CANLF